METKCLTKWSAGGRNGGVQQRVSWRSELKMKIFKSYCEPESNSSGINKRPELTLFWAGGNDGILKAGKRNFEIIK